MATIGTTGNDSIAGGSGNDTIFALGGDDTVAGDAGSDFIAGGNGSDALYGGGDADLLLGRGGDDYLDGEEGADLAIGGSGGDTLIGLSGDDTLVGAAGDDVYIIDEIEAKVSVVEAAGGGYDTITISGHSYTVASEIESAVLTGYGRDGSILIGNESDNYLSVLSDAQDIRVFGNGGDDLIFLTSKAFANGGAGNDTLIGSGAADDLNGGGGDDILDASLGNATLHGDSGHDVFILGAGADGAVTIADYNGWQDLIHLSGFAGLGSNGALSAQYFKEGAAATDADDRIIFDEDGGFLYYDADGNGAAEQLLIAAIDVESGLLNHSDFVVV